jgi:hypothetical protein
MRISGLVLAGGIFVIICVGALAAPSPDPAAVAAALPASTAAASATATPGTPASTPEHTGHAGPTKGPPPDGRRPPMRVSPMFAEVTDKDIAEILAFVDANLPWMRSDLDKMKQNEPERFHQTCRQLRFEMGRLKDMQTRDPEGFKKAIEAKQLLFNAADLAAKARAATDPKEREALTSQLRDVLAKLVDTELDARQAQVRQLEQRLAQLREDLKKRAAAKDDIVKQRLADILSGKTEPDKGGKDGPRPDRPEKPEPK